MILQFRVYVWAADMLEVCMYMYPYTTMQGLASKGVPQRIQS